MTNTGDRADKDLAAQDGSTSRSMLSGVQHADPDAWRRLVTLYAPLVAVWCRRWGVAQQDTMDVVQDVLTSVARSVDRFRKDQEHHTFRGWLARITRNKVYDYFRARGGEPAGAGGTEAWHRISQARDPFSNLLELDEVEEDAFGQVLAQAMESIRSEFQERTWLAFWKTVVEGKDTSDVANELGMRPGTVRVAKSRVLCRLRKQLGDKPN